jgi:hypothetical protein
MSDETSPAEQPPPPAPTQPRERAPRTHIMARGVEEIGTLEQLSALYAALAEAQGQFAPILRDRTGRTGNQTYKYATLASVLNSVRPALSANGLAVAQPISFGDEWCYITTVLAHRDGARLVSVCGVQLAEEIKDFGSNRTYMCRYALQSLLVLDGDADADELPQNEPLRTSRDDRPQTPRRNAAPPPPATSKPKPEVPAKEQQEAPKRDSAPPAAGVAPKIPTPPFADGPGITGETSTRITELLATSGLDKPTLAQKIRELTGRSSSELSKPGGEAAALKVVQYLESLVRS